MKHNVFFLSALSMGLLYFSLYMGMIVVNLRGTLRAGNMDQGVILHYVVILLCGFVVYLFVRKGAGPLRFLSVFLAFSAFFCFIVPFLPEALFVGFFEGMPPVLALNLAIFTPIGLFLFARSMPIGREAFAFAILIAGSELLWALFFPLLDLINSAAANQYAVHLFSLCCWTVGGAGLCLAGLLAASGKKPETAEQGNNGFYEYKKWHILAVVFIAGIIMWMMMGFQMGVLVPKMALKSEILGLPHFLFLLMLPFIGWTIDAYPVKVIKVLAPALVCAFILSLMHNADYIGVMPLYYLLNVMQAVVTVSIYAAAAKLLKTHSTLPIFMALAQSLLLFVQYLGLVLRRQALEIPYGLFVVSLLLLMGMGLCLWYFYGLILARRRQGFISYEAGRQMEAENGIQKLSAFAAAHALTARERDVLLCLLKGVHRKDMKESLGMAERTLRYHIANMQKKTSMPNEKSLMDYYNSWKKS